MTRRNLPRKILIVRSSAIGDIAMASPMLRTISKGFSGVRIFWLVEPGMRPVLAENHLVDQLLVWPKNTWIKMLKAGRFIALIKEIANFKRALRREEFDIVLDAQGLFRSRFLAFLTGAPERIGFDSQEPGRFLMSRIIARGGQGDRMSSEYQYMMEEIGLKTGTFHQCLEVGPGDEEAAGKALEELGVAKTFIAAAPFTTRAQKHWFSDRWAETAQRLKSQFGTTVVLLGGPGDENTAGEICAKAKGGAVSLAGKLTLSASMAVLKQANLVLGVDTGLTHMGPAFQRPTLALFGATCPYLYTSRSNSRVLYHPMECSPCKRNPSCESAYHCMKAITVEEVIANVGELLEKENYRL